MPKKIGPYVLQDLLGTGGMGAVYRAIQENLDRPVALKILKPGTSMDSDSVARFYREMKLMAGLRHANVVEIVDGGEVDGYPFIAMELVPGESLDKLLEKVGALPSGLVLAMTSRILEGLAYLHERQILHRDLKPANIRVSDEGLVKLLDFGLAKMSNATVMTVEGTVLGTVQYIAPEVLLGENVSTRSDMWAVGCILYVLLTGKMIADAPSLEQWIDQVSAQPIRPPILVKPDLPQEVSDLVLTLLAQDPEARPRSAKRVMKQVDDLLFALTEKTWESYLYPGFLRDVKTGAGYVSATIPVMAGASLRNRVSSKSIQLPGKASGRFAQPAPAAPPAPPRRGVALIAVLCAVLLAAPLALWPRRDPTPAGSSSPSPGAPGASAAPTPPKQLPLTARYQTYEQYLPILAVQDDKARELAARLAKELAPFDLGEPRIWAHWIRVNRWLATKPGPEDRPPRDRESVSGEIPYIEMKIVFGYLERIESGYNNYMVASAYRGVTQFPDDGRPWLLLGHALELEGRLEDAKLVYRLALQLLDKTPTDFRECPIVVWAGMVRAWLHRGDVIEKNWWNLNEELLKRHEAWDGLKTALAGSDPEVYRRVLLRALEEGRAQKGAWAIAMTRLAQFELDHGRWRESIEILERALARSHDGPIVNQLITYHLQRGLLAKARDYHRMNPLNGKDWMDQLLPYLNRPLGTGAEFDRPLYTQLIRPVVLELEVMRQVEIGQLDGARRDLVAAASGKDLRAIWEPGLHAAEILAGMSGPDEALEKLLEDCLFGEEFRVSMWARAAGSFSTGNGIPRMEKLLARAGERWKDVESVTLIRALWQSRCGKDREALQTLTPVLAATKRQLPEDLVLEIVTRPFWMQVVSGDPEILDRIRELPDFKLSSHIRPYWEAVEEGDLPEAYERAKDLFMANPYQSIWALSVLWFATGGETPEKAREWRNTLRASFRYNLLGTWLLRELEVLDRKVGK